MKRIVLFLLVTSISLFSIDTEKIDELRQELTTTLRSLNMAVSNPQFTSPHLPEEGISLLDKKSAYINLDAATQLMNEAHKQSQAKYQNICTDEVGPCKELRELFTAYKEKKDEIISAYDTFKSNVNALPEIELTADEKESRVKYLLGAIIAQTQNYQNDINNIISQAESLSSIEEQRTLASRLEAGISFIKISASSAEQHYQNLCEEDSTNPSCKEIAEAIQSFNDTLMQLNRIKNELSASETC